MASETLWSEDGWSTVGEAKDCPPTPSLMASSVIPPPITLLCDGTSKLPLFDTSGNVEH